MVTTALPRRPFRAGRWAAASRAGRPQGAGDEGPVVRTQAVSSVIVDEVRSTRGASMTRRVAAVWGGSIRTRPRDPEDLFAARNRRGTRARPHQPSIAACPPASCRQTLQRTETLQHTKEVPDLGRTQRRLDVTEEAHRELRLEALDTGPSSRPRLTGSCRRAASLRLSDNDAANRGRERPPSPARRRVRTAHGSPTACYREHRSRPRLGDRRVRRRHGVLSLLWPVNTTTPTSPDGPHRRASAVLSSAGVPAGPDAAWPDQPSVTIGTTGGPKCSAAGDLWADVMHADMARPGPPAAPSAARRSAVWRYAVSASCFVRLGAGPARAERRRRTAGERAQIAVQTQPNHRES